MRALAALTVVALAAIAATRAEGLREVVAGDTSFDTVPPPPEDTSPPPTTAGPTIGTVASQVLVPPVPVKPAPPLAGLEFGFFDYVLASEMRGSQGFSITVAQNGQVVHEFASGYDKPGGAGFDGLVTPENRFRIASNSKTITAIVTLQLVDEGKLRLDEPVLGRLAELLGVQLSDQRMQTVTVRQLLMHRSGFAERFEVFFRGGAQSCTDAARRGLTEGLGHSPGSMDYSNMNYCLLGLLIEQVTGVAYERAVQEYLLQPLGITQMRTAKTHDVQPGDVEHQSGELRDYMEALGGAGAWIATSRDLVTILDSIDPFKPGWHPLKPETAALMAEPAVGVTRAWTEWYGLGLRCWRDGTFGHTGTVESSRSMMVHRPDGITWALVAAGNVPGETDNLRGIVDRALDQVGVPRI